MGKATKKALTSTPFTPAAKPVIKKFDPYDFFEDTEELTGCCGVQVIYGFHQRPTSATGKDFLDVLASHDDARGDEFGLRIVSLVDSQKSAIKLVVDAGFTLLARFKNPKTGRMVNLYGI